MSYFSKPNRRVQEATFIPTPLSEQRSEQASSELMPLIESREISPDATARAADMIYFERNPNLSAESSCSLDLRAIVPASGNEYPAHTVLSEPAA